MADAGSQGSGTFIKVGKYIMRVTVFGSSMPKQGSPEYQAGLDLGTMLGLDKHTVLTGGYLGVMEAVSRGVGEAGGYVIGVTCDQIETWRPLSPNQWVQKELRFPTLRERLYCLVEECDAALALPGGVGTLAEVSMMWSHIQTQAIKPKPLILIGAGWRTTFNQLFASMGHNIGEDTQELLRFAPDVTAAYKLLQDMV